MYFNSQAALREAHWGVSLQRRRRIVSVSGFLGCSLSEKLDFYAQAGTRKLTRHRPDGTDGPVRDRGWDGGRERREINVSGRAGTGEPRGIFASERRNNTNRVAQRSEPTRIRR